MPYNQFANCTSQLFSGYDRVRVDVGQTGFFEGRMFRTYDKISLAAAGTLSYRVTAPVAFILHQHKLALKEGGLSIAIFDSTATPSGSWTALPIIGVNRMTERRSPFYAAQMIVEKGGTFTGGTELDYFELLVANAVSQASLTDETEERGLPASTFYIRASVLAGVSGTTSGVMRLQWEERPSSVSGWNAYDGVR